MTDFSSFGLVQPILKAVEGEGYSTPTPIQAQAIPAVMKGADLLGIAQTGTGKTAAFALPILHRLAETRRPAPRRGCRVLVLSPTRELASQIADSFKAYGCHLGMSVGVVFGGVGYRPQIQALARGLDVLVATPGRLLDHLGERALSLGETEIFVLDEADQMLDLGFVKPIRRIVAMLAPRRQNLFFSATMPQEIAGLAGELLKDPVKIAVTPVARTADRVAQSVLHVARDEKRAVLVDLLASPAMARTLVFTRTKRGADRVARHLTGAGIDAAAIHGNKSQRQREEALEGFRCGETRVLVATDIAARGIDIDNVTHVVNFELPEVPETYVHRIGRTARAGAAGQAISLCDREERDLLRAIERLIRQSIAVVGEPAPAEGPAPAGQSAGRHRPGQGRQPRGREHGNRGRQERHEGARRERAVGHQQEHARPADEQRREPRNGEARQHRRDRAAAHNGHAGSAPERRNAGDRGRPRPSGEAQGRLERMSWMKPRSAAS